jgi:predicted NAD/FAD-binding protein
VTVFAVSRYRGGHSNTIRVDTAHGTYSVDTGFIVFTDRNYQTFARQCEIGGRNRTHSCGAYWRWGFHADSVESAVRVAEHLGTSGI